MSRQGTLTTVKRRFMGLALLMCMVLFVSLTVAIYQKAFKPVVDVVLHTESTGNQLHPRSDVKVRGVTVGKVREITADGQGATLRLALEPSKVDSIPSNVTARLLPKSLFGSRYVALRLPENPASSDISEGDVISQDRTKASIEIQNVFDETLKVLRAVQPSDLAATLNALSKALNGRGEDIGRTITQLNKYVDGLNPAIPDLQRNLEELVGVAETYDKAAPDVLRALRDLTTTSRTLVRQQSDLKAVTTQTVRTSDDLRGFLRANRDSLIRLNDSARPTLDVLAKYAPGYRCFLRQMNELIPRIDKAFGAGTNEPGLHITLEVTSHRGKYVPGRDNPEYNDRRGPRCYDFKNRPQPLPQYPPDGPVKDGSYKPPAGRTSNEGLNPPSGGEQYQNSPEQQASTGSGGPAGTAPQSASSGPRLANSPAEQEFIATVMAPSVGKSPDKIPSWSSLLVGPLLRGGEVSYR